MREPYETLLGHYHEHYWLAYYLTGEVPDWGGIREDPRLSGLGTGELVLIDFAACLNNVEKHCDADNQIRVMSAMAWLVGVRN